MEEFGRRLYEMTFGRAPRFRYFQRKNGPMFCWTTETVEGRYASMVYVPVGRGSRSGKAVQWRIADESISGHQLRRDAKARALRLYREFEAGDKHPW